MKGLISELTTQNEVNSTFQDVKPVPLLKGQVRVRTEYSSLNYKDALGVTGRGPIFRTFPMVGGIDASGTVIESLSPHYTPGDQVLVTGCGFGETHNGGYATQFIEDETNLVPLPASLTAEEAMIYGTAGFTAALALERMLQNDQTPDKGPLLVTGASGGVGQFAISFFSKSGFEVWALSGKVSTHPLLKSRGATRTLTPSELKLSTRALDKGDLGGVVDNVGGKTLAGLLPRVNLWGNVCCIGLAESAQLQTTLMPFILRGVSLLGISSNNTPRALREKIWARLSTDLKPKDLNSYVTHKIGLQDILSYSHKLLNREISGRTLVEVDPRSSHSVQSLPLK